MDPWACLLYAVIGGLLTSAGSNVIPYVQHRCGVSRKSSSFVLFVANVLLNLAGVACFVKGAQYGPVAVLMPILTASKLFSSMVFQMATGTGRYLKEKRVGTLVLCSAALCLIEVGPTDLPGTVDAFTMMTAPVAVAWLALMATTLLGCLVVYHVQRGRAEAADDGIVFLSAIVAISTALGASFGKILSITTGSLWLFHLVMYAVCGSLSFVYAAFAAFSCDMSIFLPVSECLQLLVNCATGLLIWGDWHRVRGGISYAMVYLLICLGVYLCSSVDLMSHLQHEGVRPLEKVASRLHVRTRGPCCPPMKWQRHTVSGAWLQAGCPQDVAARLRRIISEQLRTRLTSKEEVQDLLETLRQTCDGLVALLDDGTGGLDARLGDGLLSQ